jgi:hypothetical protein
MRSVESGSPLPEACPASSPPVSSETEAVCVALAAAGRPSPEFGPPMYEASLTDGRWEVLLFHPGVLGGAATVWVEERSGEVVGLQHHR